MEKEIIFCWKYGETELSEVFNVDDYKENENDRIDYLCEIESIFALVDKWSNKSYDSKKCKTVIEFSNKLQKATFCFKNSYRTLFKLMNENWLEKKKKYFEENIFSDSPEMNEEVLSTLDDYFQISLFWKNVPDDLKKLYRLNVQSVDNVLAITLLEAYNFLKTEIVLMTELDLKKNVAEKVKLLVESQNKLNSENLLKSVNLGESDFYKVEQIISDNDLRNKKYSKGHGCFAILVTDLGKCFSLSGVDYDSSGIHKEKIASPNIRGMQEIATAIKNEKTDYMYAQLNDESFRCTPWITNRSDDLKLVEKPVKLGDEKSDGIENKPIGFTYGCCERKMIPFFPNASKFEFFIKYPPCTKCIPAMPLENCKVFNYARYGSHKDSVLPDLFETKIVFEGGAYKINLFYELNYKTVPDEE